MSAVMDELSAVAMRVKRERDELLAALDKLQEAARNRRMDADALDDAASEARALIVRVRQP